MGMYTELNMNSPLIEDVPDAVIYILLYMLDNDRPHPILPDHPLFDDTRWSFMLRSDSYYFDADTHSTLRYDDIAKQYYLNIQCNLKNYDREIQKFIDWISPYLDKRPREYLGYWRYEEDNAPTMIYMGDKL